MHPDTAERGNSNPQVGSKRAAAGRGMEKRRSAKGWLVAVALLVAIGGWFWYDNAADLRWAERVRQKLEGQGFVLIDAEKRADLANPVSWIEAPIAVLRFCAPDESVAGLSVLASGVLHCGVSEVFTNDFRDEIHANYLFTFDPARGKVNAIRSDLDSTTQSESGYEEPKGWKKRIVDWMRQHAKLRAGQAPQRASEAPGALEGKTGELGPHLKSPEFEFVGAYDRDYVYIRPSQTGRLANSRFVADVFIFKEEWGQVVIDAASGRVAVLPAGQGIERQRQLAFIVPPPDSSMARVVARLRSPDRQEAGDREGRNRRRWLYAGLTRDLWATYVSTSREYDTGSGFTFWRVLTMREQRYQLYFDPDKRMFAPVETDFMGTPKEQLRYGPMRDGTMESKVWDAIKGRLPPE
jgi:hypothetical protein